MRKQANIKKDRATARDIILISKIYQSFEALEETLGKLKLEEPLFITHVAKKSFAEIIFKNIDEAEQKKLQEECRKKLLEGGDWETETSYFAFVSLGIFPEDFEKRPLREKILMFTMMDRLSKEMKNK